MAKACRISAIGSADRLIGDPGCVSDYDGSSIDAMPAGTFTQNS
jgi:hypothetical protein